MPWKIAPRTITVFHVVKNVLLVELLIRLLYGFSGIVLHTGTEDRIPSSRDKLLEITERNKNRNAPPWNPPSLNAHANIFNRPLHVFEHRAEYLGPRPHVDTEADLQAIINKCTGGYERNEKMLDIASCMQFLAEREDAYYRLPKPELRASAQDPRHAEYENADGHFNSLRRYPSYSAPSKNNPGSCPGPIIPYHTYWNGDATWRVEAFIKSYLFTQNLACSRLWIWFDADHHPNAERIILKDPAFTRFLPLVERGDLLVKGWRFPSQVTIPNFQDHQTERDVSEAPEQLYIDIKARLMPFQPAALSDAVRFIMLHLHGGVYLDIDMLLLRDLRPLLLPKEHGWAERWGTALDPGDYNTAVMSLSANSSLSTYFLLGAVRTGVHFHPRALGRMAVDEQRDREFFKLEDAAFDPTWSIFEEYKGKCTVPCLTSIDDAFRARPFQAEWDAFEGEQLKPLDAGRLGDMDTRLRDPEDGSATSLLASILAPSHSETLNITQAALRQAGVIGEYQIQDDVYAPTNRSLQNFYRGAWAYHVHNQVSSPR